MDKLTQKQQAWIDYYKQGKSQAEAARLAGYRGKNLNVVGYQNFTKLRNYIQDRDSILEKPRIAGMEEINRFWTDVIRDKEAAMKDRIKASELRARTEGAFIDKLEVSGEVQIDDARSRLAEKLTKKGST